MGKIATKKKTMQKTSAQVQNQHFYFFGVQKTDKKNTQYKTHTHTHTHTHICKKMRERKELNPENIYIS